MFLVLVRVQRVFDLLSKDERNWLIQQLQHFAKHKRVRVSFLSGDVHCAAVGVLKTFAKGKKSAALDPAVDHRYMINVVSSQSDDVLCQALN